MTITLYCLGVFTAIFAGLYVRRTTQEWSSFWELKSYPWYCRWDSKMVRVWARYSDRKRANPIIAFIVLDPRLKEVTLDDFGATIQMEPANARLAAHSVAADAQTPLERLPRTTSCFSSYLPRPNGTLFVVTRPLVHDAMSILVPDRWIFIVKACRAFFYGRERACRLKSNIPRKIKSDVLLGKALAY